METLNAASTAAEPKKSIKVNDEPACLVFVAEVIGIFEKAGRKMVKVALKECITDLPIEAVGEVHLGDGLIIDAGAILKSASGPSSPRTLNIHHEPSGSQV